MIALMGRENRAGPPPACLDALGAHLRPEVFRALCDPSRLALVGRLAGAREPMTVSDAGSCCGVHISGVSRHLSQLRQAGIVRADKRGREVLYRLDMDHLVGTLRGLADALDQCREACCPPSGADDAKR